MKNKVSIELSDFQIGMQVRLNTNENNYIMSINAIIGTTIYCDFIDANGKNERKGFHWKQLEII